MTGVGLEPTPSMGLVPQPSHLDHPAILPVGCVVNSIDDGRRYHLQVFNINDTILSIAMSMKYQEWDSDPRHRSDWCLKLAP